jgi:hypothetical protein
MGYRSDVAVVIYGDQRDLDKYGALKVLMNTTFKLSYTEFEINAEWHDSKGVLMFKIDDVKWYDSYLDVQDFMKMLREIEDLEGYNYEFMRVGEDTEDIETQHGGSQVDYLLRVTRSIEVDL